MINRSMTFPQKLALGFAVMVIVTALIGMVAVYALRTAISSKDHVIEANAQVLIETGKLHTLAEKRVASLRGYLLLQDERFLTQLQTAREEFTTIVERLRKITDSDDERQFVNMIERVMNEYQQVSDQLIGMVRNDVKIEEVIRHFEEKLTPVRRQLDTQLRSLIVFEERQLAEAKTDATKAASSAITLVVSLAIISLVFAIAVAFLLTRILSRQIGAAVGHVQSSSAELQAAASQQASGAKEQATAMSEITTTISELVATSRQIAESAQRVSQIAEQMAMAARAGDNKVEKGQDSMASMRKQVDQVVSHMLDLGRKSQEIGAILDIVAELAEQTNILAINATIEAAGAGDAGKRFTVVADEIRKLADRVGNATKDIRTQIDDVRSAVNTTVMATENSAKAVDAGARQFTEVAAAFKQITELVVTTTGAAREIELSTKQQASAAEQVRIAVTDVSQATRETETSTSQTLQTASQLAGLSLELRRLIQPQTN